MEPGRADHSACDVAMEPRDYGSLPTATVEPITNGSRLRRRRAVALVAAFLAVAAAARSRTRATATALDEMGDVFQLFLLNFFYLRLFHKAHQHRIKLLVNLLQ